MSADGQSSRTPAKRDKEKDRDLIGQVVAGKYRVLDLLGQGGFGSVFLVEMTSGMVGDRLAMKVLPRELSENALLRDQFLNEIRVAMKMVDKYIVQIRDVGVIDEADQSEARGLMYYTMDYVPGVTLAAVLRERGTLSVPRAMAYVLRVLRALRTAHAAGIIHRDLKPANVMVVEQDGKETTRVLDFGIATAIGGEGGDDAGTGTGTGGKKTGFAGSPYYMPPEQFLGTELGFYTDLYSVGVIIYECLTGRRPYTGHSPQEVYDNLKKGPPIDIVDLAPEVDEYPGLADAIRKALERNPEKRFQTAKEMMETLNGILKGEGDTPPPGRRSPARSIPRRSLAAGRGRPVATRRPTVAPPRKASPVPAFMVSLLIVAIAVVGVVFKDRILESLGMAEPAGAPGKPGGSPGDPNGGATNGGGPATATSGSNGTKSSTGDPKDAGKTGGPKGSGRAEDEVLAAKKAAARRLDDMLRAGFAAIEKEDWKTAEENAAAVLAVRKNDARALLLRGTVQLRLRQPLDAIRTLEPVLKLAELRREDSIHARLLLADANAALAKPRWDNVESQLASILRDDPTHAATARRMAEFLRDRGRKADLLAHLKACHEREVKDQVVAALYQKLVVEAAARTEAEFQTLSAAAREAYDKRDWTVAAMQATKALERRKALDIALIAHESRCRIEDSGGARSSLAIVEELVAADAELTKSEEWQLRLPYLQGLTSYIHYEETGKKASYNAAIVKLDKVKALSSKKKSPDIWAWSRTYLGLALAKATRDIGRVDDEFGPTKDIRDAELIYVQARAFQKLARKKRAKQERLRCYSLAKSRLLNLLKVSRLPEDLEQEAYLRLGECYLQVGLIDESDNYLRRAVNRFGEAKKKGLQSTALYENLGATYVALDEYIKAAQSYREAYYLKPTVDGCLRAAEFFLKASSGKAPARQLLEEGLTRFEDDPKLLKMLAQLRNR